MRIMEITSEIFQVGGEGFTSAQDAAVFLVLVNGQSVLIDAGCGLEEGRLLKNIESVGINPKQINLLLLTHSHYDHCGGASSLKKKLGCKTVAHYLDAEYLEKGDNVVTAATWYDSTITPVKIDRQLKNPVESIFVGGREINAIHIPGHSPGSVAYAMESDGKKVIFGQDVHGPLHPSLKSNENDYKISLKKLIALEADILCEGHYGVIEGKKPIIDFITSYLNQ